MVGENSFWSRKKVFVTGAAGLLGSWLVKSLLEGGAHVVCLIRDVTPQSLLYSSGMHAQVVCVQGDLVDLPSLVRILNDYDIDTVFHLGAQAIVGHANRSPLDTFKSNIEGTWNVLEACRLSPWVKRVIVASSDKAYGDSLVLPYTEDMPLQGRYSYDVSKSCTDLIAQSYFYTYGLPVCITRCGNIFGGGDLHFNRLIPGTIDAFLHNRSPIIRSDGSLIRDYVYVEDIVEAYLALGKAMDRSAIWGQAFNISEGEPKTVLQVVLAVRDILGLSLEPCVENRAQCEIQAQYLCAKKIKDVTDWSAKYGFLKGLMRTIEWYQKNIHKKYDRMPAHRIGENYNEV